MTAPMRLRWRLLGPLLASLVHFSAEADYEAGLNAALAGDYETAFREFRPVAEHGLDLAQYNLAILYYTGRGVERDYRQAFLWTERAARQGHLDAQANLGSLYLSGEGVNRDLSLALDWLGLAARAGHAEAAYSLANMYEDGSPLERDRVFAHAWANQALANGHDAAQALIERLERRLDPDQLGSARRVFARWQIEPLPSQPDSAAR